MSGIVIVNENTRDADHTNAKSCIFLSIGSAENFLCAALLACGSTTMAVKSMIRIRLCVTNLNRGLLR